MKDVLLVIPSKNLEGSPVSWGKMLTYLRLWLLMSSVATGWNTRAYRDNSYPGPFKGAPFRLHSFISFARFDTITEDLSLTDFTPPLYRDKFWEVQQIIHAWNWHMSDVFLDGWVYCLDESMSIWTSRWTCPGFMFVPRKPHPVVHWRVAPRKRSRRYEGIHIKICFTKSPQLHHVQVLRVGNG